MKKTHQGLFAKLTVIVFIVFTITQITYADAVRKYDLPSSIKTTTVYYAEKDTCGENYRYVTNRITYTYSYKYDKYGHITSSTIDDLGKTKYAWKYKKNRPVQMTIGKKKNSYFYKKLFDKNGRLKKIQSYWYDKKGKKTAGTSATYSYNKKGWINKCTIKYSSGDTFVSKYGYKFHKNGFPKSITEKNRYGTKKVIVNENGLITNNGTKTYKYKYNYDKKGRVNRCVIKILNNYSGKVINEEYIYYKYSNYKTSDKKAYFAAINNCPFLLDSYVDDASINTR